MFTQETTLKTVRKRGNGGEGEKEEEWQNRRREDIHERQNRGDKSDRIDIDGRVSTCTKR